LFAWQKSLLRGSYWPVPFLILGASPLHADALNWARASYSTLGILRPTVGLSFRHRLAYAILFTMQTLRSIRALSFVLSVFVSGLQAIAQQPPQAVQKPTPASPTFSVKVKEVNLLAIVRDKKGQPVNSLDKKDFVLEQDGRAQTITQLAHESDLPLTLGVLADTGPGQRKALADERKAGTDFVNRLLREGKDKAFVLHFDKEVELLQDVTTSHDKLAKGIDQISVGNAPHNSGGGRGRNGDDSQHPHYFFGGSMLYDAIFLSSDEVLKSQQGRKAVVLFSDGVDRESKTTLQRAIESAQRADTLVYCVYVAAEREEQEGGSGGQRRGGGYPGGGGGYPGGGGPFPGGGYPGGGGRRRGPESTPHENKIDGKKILQQISKETGGRYFELSKKLTATQIYAQIEEEMRHQYSLSYTPDESENGYHKLHLSTHNADLTVQTREGFYAE
jgi:VWFA-related protein